MQLVPSFHKIMHISEVNPNLTISLETRQVVTPAVRLENRWYGSVGKRSLMIQFKLTSSLWCF